MEKDLSDKTIELDKCPNGGLFCPDLLENVNNLLHNANLYAQNKEYSRALELKETAFNQIVQLKNDRCQPCGTLFREVILNSVKMYITDLEKMSSGFFGKKKYKYHLKNAERLFKRMENYLEKYNPSQAEIQKLKKA